MLWDSSGFFIVEADYDGTLVDVSFEGNVAGSEYVSEFLFKG